MVALALVLECIEEQAQIKLRFADINIWVSCQLDCPQGHLSQTMNYRERICTSKGRSPEAVEGPQKQFKSHWKAILGKKKGGMGNLEGGNWSINFNHLMMSHFKVCIFTAADMFGTEKMIRSCSLLLRICLWVVIHQRPVRTRQLWIGMVRVPSCYTKSIFNGCLSNRPCKC